MIRIKITSVSLLFPIFVSTVICFCYGCSIAGRGPSPSRFVGTEPGQ